MRVVANLCLAAIVVLIPALHGYTKSTPTSSRQFPNSDDYLTWSADQAISIGKNWRVNGRVGGAFDWRVIHTEHSYNYKLRGTLMTPEVIRATARLEQLRSHLTDDQTRALVAEAERGSSLVVLVEIDAREGSGVIPLDWRSTLKPGGAKLDSPVAIGGISTPSLRNIKALAGVSRRDYAYDIFWVAFPLTDQGGKPIWDAVPSQIELVVGIYNKEGRVVWNVSEPMQKRLRSIIGK